MKIIHEVRNNIVINRILVDDNYDKKHFPNCQELDESVQIGWKLSKKKWYTPEVKTEIELPTIEKFLDIIEIKLSKVSKSKGYDSILSLISFKDDPNPIYQAEALAGITFRSKLWDYYIKESSKEILIPIKDFIENMPTIDWPN